MSYCCSFVKMCYSAPYHCIYTRYHKVNLQFMLDVSTKEEQSHVATNDSTVIDSVTLSLNIED